MKQIHKSLEDGVGQEQALCLSPVAITWVDLLTQRGGREGGGEGKGGMHAHKGLQGESVQYTVR